MLKNDLLTGEYFLQRRSNQKFANRLNRIAFHNNKARVSRSEKISCTNVQTSNTNKIVNTIAWGFGIGVALLVYAMYKQEKRYKEIEIALKNRRAKKSFQK